MVRKTFNSFDYYKEAYDIHQQRINILETEKNYLYKIITTDSLINDSEGVKNQDLLSAVSIYQTQKQESLNSLKIAQEETKKQTNRKQFWKITTFVVVPILVVETAILILIYK